MRVKWFYCLSVPGTAILLLARGAAAQAPVRPSLHAQPLASTAPIGYTPNQIRHAYGFDQLASTGAGQTIAIVDAYGSATTQQDLDVFCAQFGIPSTRIQFAYPTGRPTATDGGWALETSLDVEWAHVIAPGATILLVVARTSSFADLFPAVDYAATHARQVSMSWGTPEFGSETNYDFHFNVSGVTFTASSGDGGAGDLWPAISPYVTSVGGTTLSLADSSGTWGGETGWAGSGGGVSGVEPEFHFQRAWQSTGRRSVPDVSYDGDPNTGVAVYDTTSYSGQTGWFQVGGTSVGAPQWAALIALANAGRASSLNITNYPLYSLGSPSTFTGYYHDITRGSNGSFSAGPGYDLVTGIGSPLANSLIPALTASAAIR